MSDPTTAETPTMRERLAQACADEWEEDCPPDAWFGMVDAILREMLEPSEGMVKAGVEAVDNYFHGSKGGTFEQSMEVALKAMIQYLLNETKD